MGAIEPSPQKEIEAFVTENQKINSDNLITGLVRALYWADESLQNELASRGHRKLSRRHSLIMANIAHGGVRPSHLAQNLGISRQAVHQTLKEMEKDGLITMRPDPDDSRAVIAEFCKDAKSIRDDALDASHKIMSDLGGRIGGKSVKALMEILYQDWGPAIGSSDKV